MIETLIIVEHEEIFVSNERNIDKKIISEKDKKELFSIEHTDRFNKKTYVFSRKGRDGIKANSIVGSISLKSGLIIEILPKFAKENDLKDEKIIKKYRKNLLRMIQVSNEKNFISSTLQSSKVSAGEMPLIHYMIELFSESLLHSLRNSMVSTYNKTIENSSLIRGNILLTKTLQNNIVDKSKVYISYNKHSSNNLLMQIFKTLAKLLLNDTNLSYRAKQYLYEVYILLDSVDSISLKQYHFEKVIFNRLNDKYEILFKQAEFIFNQYMPFTSNINSTPFWAILFNMDYLFEKFCAYLLRRSQIEIVEQEKVPAFEHDNVLISAKPDFIIKEQVDSFHQKSINVIDAKWKLLDNEKTLYGLNTQNFWQLFSYMNLMESEEVNGYFIVPKNSNEFDDKIIFEPIREGNKSISILSIDFSLEFEEILNRYQFKLNDGYLVVNLQEKKELVVEDKEVTEIKIEPYPPTNLKNKFEFNLEEFIKELETLHNNKNIRKRLSHNKKDERFKNLYHLKEVYNSTSKIFKLSIKENLDKESWNFESLAIKYIPSNIVKLKNILALSLSNNKIQDLPIELFRLKKIMILNISNNTLQSLPKEIINLKNLKLLIIDKELAKNNIDILKELKNQGVKVEDDKKNNLIKDILMEKAQEIKKNFNKKEEPAKYHLLTIEQYSQLTKEEKLKFVDESDFSLVSREIIELIMVEKDIDILEDFTYNQTLPLSFAFATYNNHLERELSEVNRLKENLIKREHKILNLILSLEIKKQEIYIQNNFNKLEKDILLGYAMSKLLKFKRIRELISKQSTDLDILNELSKNKDDEKVLLNIMFKNREYKEFQNIHTNYSTIILDRIAHYHQYYEYENKFCLITKLARNYSLTDKTKEYLFEKYKKDKVFLEELSQNNSKWELQNKIEKELSRYISLETKKFNNFEKFNSINFESKNFR